MYIELHQLQSFAPSNLNRDDSGMPKRCVFGGFDRARISSQCLKRAIRKSDFFRQATGVPNGERTQRLIEMLKETLAQNPNAATKPVEEIERVATTFAAYFVGGLNSKKLEQTNVLLYISPAEVETMVEALLDDWNNALVVPPPDEKGKIGKAKHPVVQAFSKEVKNLKRREEYGVSAPDIALFGRMLAEAPEINLEATCQVAHAISTHEVKMEIDYFTAMDDRQPPDEPGAAHVNAAFFNSACFYRYARIDWAELVKNLRSNADLARRTVDGFLRGAAFALPSGKQNAMSTQTDPALMLAVVRDDGLSWSLVNAFEAPVYPWGNNGIIAPSFEALDEFWGYKRKRYGAIASLKQVLALPLDPKVPLGPDSGHHLSQHYVEDLSAFFDGVLDALPQNGS